MNTEKQAVYITREALLNLLTDAEVASVSRAETASGLAQGEEYLDLEKLDQGVRRAGTTPPEMGRALPRKSVHADTWSRILTQLAATPS